MSVPIASQPNIKHGLQDHTNIALNLFNTIIGTTNTHVELKHSWAVIERYISAEEQLEVKRRQPINQQ
jgi:hypothetical protein